MSNLVWLHCNLQLRNKTVVRYGKRKEVTAGERWVFCPLQHFPRDRISINTCEKCSHFKGYSKIEVNNGKTTSQYIGKKIEWKPTELKSEEGKQTTITEADIEAAIKKIEENRKKWKKEEDARWLNGS